jgi:hypothetical protein
MIASKRQLLAQESFQHSLSGHGSSSDMISYAAETALHLLKTSEMQLLEHFPES